MEHVLPGQAPLRDFVHHNTLHGFQHLPFPAALKVAHDITGSSGYWPVEKFREQFQRGRITADDLQAVLEEDASLDSRAPVFTHAGGEVTRGDIYRIAMSYPIKPISPSQFVWQVEENHALETHGELWAACMQALQLDHYLLHSEELFNFSPERAARVFATQLDEPANIHQQVKHDSHTQLLELTHKVGKELTLRGLLLALTGEDILHDIRPLLLRQTSSWLDQGMAAWHGGAVAPGFFDAWRATSETDLTPVLEGLPDWVEHLNSLPTDPQQTIIAELQRIGIPTEHRDAYLERLALELPGWSGMFLWRHLHPGYVGEAAPKADMLDYLAVRLSMEHLFARRLCRKIWLMEANLGDIRGRFRRHPEEFLVRYYTFNRRLPEYLLTPAQQLIRHSRPRVYEDQHWEELAHQIWTWNQVFTPHPNPSPSRGEGLRESFLAPPLPLRERGLGGEGYVYDHGWRLFLLAQHLGMDATTVCSLERGQLDTLFTCLAALDEEHAGFLWLQAYERHYREQVFNAIASNHGRGAWRKRDQRPEAQLVFCMDDREEGIRRHLEELNPQVETLGAAAFFNLPMNWQGLDDKTVTKLCPVPVTPEHLVREVPADEAATLRHEHERRVTWRKRFFAGLNHVTRHNLVLGTVSQMALAPLSLGIMLGKSYMPLGFGQWVSKLRQKTDLPIPTKLEFIALQPDAERSSQHNQMGFTDQEQADKVGGFLRMIGLTDGFAPLVVIMGHGSTSQNNPHAAAYECGACSGRHSGPNARVFASMANRPAVRALLAQQGLPIPADTWFVGAEHDTCDEQIPWFDTDKVPTGLRGRLHNLQAELAEAARHSAHERCRKLASAPRNPSLAKAAAHIAGRAFDYSQPRPELGHATNACALIGRRAVTRSSFLDRRCFLISYDCTRDPDGSILENILLNAGPVGAGISLEYYFSTVNNERYGAGTKVTHNLTGLFGVMEGVFSDLRTGLPAQMIEIHEPMRLLVIVEAKIATVGAIYARQPPLQELIGGGWIVVAVKDPDSAAIDLFVPEKGFMRWEGERKELALVARSVDWYAGDYGHLEPALVTANAVTPHPLTPSPSRGEGGQEEGQSLV
ncbi:MAG: DUF2309 domain-containing protein [Gammaproteobacteria bacterium]|nr:DUF2309 domain-containing protein [Gammaproteobacteria bacterium]MBU1723548.1 DUF2309 domain-containing protein [Gammaproteobacteria bacterium]MBU2004106.1 DUF2309 domain-containing protein [Gammaproteobacteria bacterium]